MERPPESEYAPFYAGYISRVPEEEIIPVLEAQRATMFETGAAVGPERETFRYAPGKWTICEVFGHLADIERIFGCRALAISRGDRTPLPGFDENAYIAASQYGRRRLAEITREFSMLRNANLAMFRTLDDDSWLRIGTANGYSTSVRAIAYILAGHLRHHLEVLRERYGVR